MKDRADEILPHVLVLRPPSAFADSILKGWAPWTCICGAGGTGGDEDGAVAQFELHLKLINGGGL